MAQTTQSPVHGTSARNSKIILFIAGLVIFGIGLYSFQKWWQHQPKTYNLTYMPVGQTKVITIEPGDEAIVILAPEAYYPFNADNLLIANDSRGAGFKILGSEFVEHDQGFPESNDTKWTYRNQSDSTVTLKIGRCISKDSCAINF